MSNSEREIVRKQARKVVPERGEIGSVPLRQHSPERHCATAKVCETILFCLRLVVESDKWLQSCRKQRFGGESFPLGKLDTKRSCREFGGAGFVAD